MSYILRAPVTRDAALIAQLHVASWRATYGHLLPADFFNDEHLTGRRKMWDHILTQKPAGLSVQIAEHDQQVIGLALAGPSFDPVRQELPRPLQLFALYVDSDFHGVGAGQELCDSVLGDSPAMLWVAKQNPRAISFYQRNGFDFDGTEQIDPAAPGLNDALMIR